MVLLAHLSLFGGETEIPGKLQETFLGVQLGCSPSELKAVLEKGKHPCKLIKKKTEDDATIYMFNGSHQLRGADSTVAVFWNDRLVVMMVTFSTESGEELYSALKNLIEKKYGKPTDKLEFAGKKCAISVNGLRVELDYNVGIMEPGMVHLSAGHISLIEAQADKKVQDREKELGDL